MRKICLLLSAAVLLAGCAKRSDITKIYGVYTSPVGMPEAVYVSIPEMEIEQIVDVVDGKFTVEVPTDITTVGTIESDMTTVEFVPDGTSLIIQLGDLRPVVTSDKPKISTQVKYGEFIQGANKILAKQSELEEDELDKMLLDYCLKALHNNRDNAIGVTALSGIYYMLPVDQLIEELDQLDDAIKEKEMIKSILGEVDAQRNTLEGMMFSDFTIVQDPDNPETSTVKFSDYIGKGKYVLVDFWASWCGPCIKEIPNIKAVYEKYAGDKFDILSVAVWDELLETLRAATSLEIEWNQIVNAGNIPTDLYGISGIPHIILFGPDGTILKRNLRGSDIEAEVAKYVPARY